MDIDISICGSDCDKCYCFKNKMCAGCNACKGKVFHASGAECAVYSCCVTKHGYKNCLRCQKIPCDIWMKTRDPKYTDEEFDNSVKERIENLKNNT